MLLGGELLPGKVHSVSPKVLEENILKKNIKA
jgi:hypothetical protein